MDTDVYKCILRSLSEAVCAVDADSRILCFNRRAQQLTGVSREDALGASLEKLFPAQTSRLRSLVSEVMQSGEPIQGARVQLVNNDGENIPVIANMAPVLSKAGAVAGVTVILQDNRQIELLRRQLSHAYTFGDIVTKDHRVRRILENVPNVAASKSTVLIQGPTGTGKELLARVIHSSSARADMPFVAINCGALPDTLLESELFGYKKGAFTDAKRDKRGRVALAEGGTLFLDEIGDVSPAMQVKLLRVLDQKTYEPLGSTQPVKADVRILAATNRPLQEMVASGTFRADLYFRLNVIEFFLPPLCERPSDIPPLLQHFIELLNAQEGREIKTVSQRAMNYLMHYSYPGNVRELRNILEHAYVVCPGEEIQPECLPLRVIASPQAATSQALPGRATASLPLRRMSAVEQMRLIRRALKDSGNHRGKAAMALGIDKSTLWRKMKRFDIDQCEQPNIRATNTGV